MSINENGLPGRIVAKQIGVSLATLRLWSRRGSGPPFYRAGPRLIRYRKSDVDAWVQSHMSTRKDAQ
jgi:predicted DNA-binding transcriptional regulator AlpA